MTASHMSIGEVLNLLQEEFPDVTISKIRFLESQGLIDPERTPSGYRKFYASDVKRLRWILREQRENFLPLKVIKERLDDGELDADEYDDDLDPAPEPMLALAPDPEPRSVSAVFDEPPARARSPRPALDVGPSGISLTRAELCSASGVSRADLHDLERFHLVTGRALGDEVYYDEEALVVAKLAAGFKAHGIEARHLRMYKVAAEREAGVFEQVVMPLVKQRDPAARAEAVELLAALTEMGDGVRAAMLRQAMHAYLSPG
jgi:DNA-binding transcriptional MerR regulator